MTFLSHKPADELTFEDELEDPMALGGLGISTKKDDQDEDGEEDDEEKAVPSLPSNEEEEVDDTLARLELMAEQARSNEPEIDLGENDDGDVM